MAATDKTRRSEVRSGTTAKSQTQLFRPADIVSALTDSARQIVYAVQDKFAETGNKMMGNLPGQWHRGPRATFNLTTEPGVYALFLRGGAQLPGVRPGEAGLIYIGMAANRNGLRGRCHFNAQTRNHSPRKSLAVLSIDELELVPALFPKPNSQDTWGLDPASEIRLSAWMHANLELAVEVHHDPDARESELIRHHVPPLNLSKCAQSLQYRQISLARSEVLRLLHRH
jgi:hypothetical protein